MCWIPLALLATLALSCTSPDGDTNPFPGSWTNSLTGATWTFDTAGNLTISSSGVPLTYSVSGDTLTTSYTDGSGTYMYTFSAVSSNLIKLYYGVVEMDLTR